jgi:hypothetical protein
MQCDSGNRRSVAAIGGVRWAPQPAMGFGVAVPRLISGDVGYRRTGRRPSMSGPLMCANASLASRFTLEAINTNRLQRECDSGGNPCGVTSPCRRWDLALDEDKLMEFVERFAHNLADDIRPRRGEVVGWGPRGGRTRREHCHAGAPGAIWSCHHPARCGRPRSSNGPGGWLTAPTVHMTLVAHPAGVQSSCAVRAQARLRGAATGSACHAHPRSTSQGRLLTRRWPP